MEEQFGVRSLAESKTVKKEMMVHAVRSLQERKGALRVKMKDV